MYMPARPHADRANVARVRAVAIVLLALFAVSLVLASSASAAPRFAWQRNLEFAAPNGVPLQLDVVRASAAPAGPRPLVIIVHGGGWWSGTRIDNAGSNLVQQRFATAGFVTASIDYRLACGNGTEAAPVRQAFSTRFTLNSPLCGAYVPDQVQDVHAAVRYLRTRAVQFGIDQRRIALVGISAGGHLALLAAATAPYGSRVQAVANWSGATFVDDVAKQDPTRKGTIVASLTNAIGCTIYMCRDRWNAADPLRSLRTARWAFATFNASAVYERIVHPRSLAAYDRAVARRGWRHEHRMVDGVCHGTGCAGLKTTTGDGRTLTSATARFFMQSLSNPVLPKPKPKPKRASTH